MNPTPIRTHQTNIKILKSFIGKKVKSLIKEVFYYQGKLDKESRGDLKIELSDGKYYLFQNYSEGLLIEEKDFEVKENLEKEIPELKWLQTNFIEDEKVKELPKITEVKIELLGFEKIEIQTGCKIMFGKNTYLYLWTDESDNIFYSFDSHPSYESKEFSIQLVDVRKL